LINIKESKNSQSFDNKNKKGKKNEEDNFGVGHSCQPERFGSNNL